MRKTDYVYVEELDKSVKITFYFARKRFLLWNYTPKLKSTIVDFADVYDVETNFVNGLFYINIITKKPSCLNKNNEIENENVDNWYEFPELTLTTARQLQHELALIALTNNIIKLDEISDDLDDDDDDLDDDDEDDDEED